MLFKYISIQKKPQRLFTRQEVQIKETWKKVKPYHCSRQEGGGMICKLAREFTKFGNSQTHYMATNKSRSQESQSFTHIDVNFNSNLSIISAGITVKNYDRKDK